MNEPSIVKPYVEKFKEADEELHEHSNSYFSFSKEQKEHAHEVTHHHLHKK